MLTAGAPFHAGIDHCAMVLTYFVWALSAQCLADDSSSECIEAVPGKETAIRVGETFALSIPARIDAEDAIQAPALESSSILPGLEILSIEPMPAGNNDRLRIRLKGFCLEPGAIELPPVVCSKDGMNMQAAGSIRLRVEPLVIPPDSELRGLREPLDALPDDHANGSWFMLPCLAILCAAILALRWRFNPARSTAAKDGGFGAGLAESLVGETDGARVCAEVWKETLRFAVTRCGAPPGSTPFEVSEFCDSLSTLTDSQKKVIRSLAEICQEGMFAGNPNCDIRILLSESDGLLAELEEQG